MRVNGWRLVEAKTGREVEIGEVLTDFRGKTGDVLENAWPPRHSASEGKVQVLPGMGEFYASVYGLRWLEEPQ